MVVSFVEDERKERDSEKADNDMPVMEGCASADRTVETNGFPALRINGLFRSPIISLW